MLILRMLLLLSLLFVCGFAPGFFLLRHLRWSPLEKLCGSIGLSLVLLYLVTFSLYVAGTPPALFWGVAVVCALLAAMIVRDMGRLWQAGSVRKAVAGFGFLLAWTLVLLSLVRNYSGGGWTGDWLEHLHRSIFFLNHLPTQIEFLGVYKLPARPPMMNLLAALFMGLCGEQFEVFETCFAFLNLLAFFPCWLLMRSMARRGGQAMLPLVALLAASPLFAENVTYTWTKLLSAFYVLLAIAMYLSAWRKNDCGRLVAAFTAMAAGVLVHYSAGPYLVFMTGHYLVSLWWQRRKRLRELALVVALPGALLAIWLGWSLSVYGLGTTLVSNTAITPLAPVHAPAAQKIAGNIIDTLVPHIVRGTFYEPFSQSLFRQDSSLGMFRDYTFLLYQSNVILAMGAVGGLAALWLTFGRLSFALTGPRSLRRSQDRFWLLLAVVCTLGGIAVHGERDHYGVAHVTLQPVVLLGVTLVAAHFTRARRAVQVLIIVGCVADFSMGVVIPFHLQSLENTADRTVFRFQPAIRRSERGIEPFLETGSQLSPTAYINWLSKQQAALLAGQVDAFRRANPDDEMAQRFRSGFEQQLQIVRRLDQRDWGGYFARQGGRLTFIGDHIQQPLPFETALVALTGSALVGAFYFGVKVRRVSAPRHRPDGRQRKISRSHRR